MIPDKEFYDSIAILQEKIKRMLIFCQTELSVQIQLINQYL